MLVGSRTLMTAEQFAALPQPADGSRQELVKGVVVTVPPPSFGHGLVCSEATRRIGNFVHDGKPGFVTCDDSGAILSRVPDTVHGPDVGYWSKERLPVRPARGYPEIAADLAVEVMSPHDVFRSLFAKGNEYLRASTRLVRVLMPEDRSAGVFTADGRQALLTGSDVLDGGDVLPGFSCRVGDLFPA